MAAPKADRSAPDPSANEFYEEEVELKTVPVYEIDGEIYQEFRKPSMEEWDTSLMWTRHTVSSKAKDWGKVRAHQSHPIQALYQRSRNHEKVPAFKQYSVNELNDVLKRVQRPTKSGMLRSKNFTNDSETNKDSTSANSSGKSREQPSNSNNAENQKAAVERLLKPTASQARRVELTLKYRPQKSQE